MKLNYKKWQLIFFRFLEVWIRSPPYENVHFGFSFIPQGNNQFLNENSGYTSLSICFYYLRDLYPWNRWILKFSKNNFVENWPEMDPRCHGNTDYQTKQLTPNIFVFHQSKSLGQISSKSERCHAQCLHSEPLTFI